MTENDPNETNPQGPQANAAEAPNAAASAPEHAANEASADAAGDDDASHDEGDDGDEGTEGGDEGTAEVGADGSPAKKKRRRRRKKKKGAEGPAPEGAAAETHAHAKPQGHSPFGRYFEGAERKHPFSNHEEVAGIVVSVAEGVATVDLFGKGIAFVDVLEPREIAPLPEPPAPQPAAPAEAAVALEASSEPAPVDALAAAPDAAAGENPGTVDAASAPAPAETSAGDIAAAEAAVLAEAEDAVDGEAEHGDAHEQAAAPTVEDAAHEPPAVGEVFRGRIGSVSESGHLVLINRAVDRGKAKERIREYANARRRVQGVVYGWNRGGFDVIVEGIRVFCPASAMALDHIQEPEAFVGKKLEFTLPPSKGGRSIVVSRRSLLERQARRAKRDAMASLAVNSVHKGRITALRDYGVLVDIGGGLEGLVHLSELGWSRGVRPSDVGPVGTEVDVMVTRVVPISRKDRFGKISLSIRACLPDPWTEHRAILTEGHALLAKVTGTAEFGAFLEVAPGIDGMLHISELGGRDLRHANQVVKEGDEIAVAIDRVDSQSRRISLSKLSPNDAEALRAGTFAAGSTRAPKPGTTVQAVIEKVEHHGFQIQIEGVVGRKGRGYLSNRDLGEIDADRRRRMTVGSKIEVKVVGVDRDGSLKVSVKAKQIDDERNAVRDYKRESSKQGFGTFGDLLRAKLQR